MIEPGALIRILRINRRAIFASVVAVKTNERHGGVIEYRDARNSSLHVALAADVRIERARKRTA
jgi:hypothetical protein